MNTVPPDPAGRLTVGGAYRRLARRLRTAGLEDAESIAETAIGFLLHTRPLDIHVRARDAWPAEKSRTLSGMARRLEAHEPIQYVTGQAEFLRRTFAVDRRALIPRPETEHLVMDALSDPALSAIPAPRIADVGTGSGVLAVSLALARPDARVTAVDISADALELARENARRFSVEGRIAWRRHALLDGLAAGTLDAVVANLPYVPTPEIETLEARIRDHEPRVALEGGPDGLRLITRLLPQAARVLRPGGLLLLEIGDGQGPAVRDALEAGPFTAIHIRPDAAGHDRIARAVRTAIDEPVPPQ